MEGWSEQELVNMEVLAELETEEQGAGPPRPARAALAAVLAAV